MFTVQPSPHGHARAARRPPHGCAPFASAPFMDDRPAARNGLALTLIIHADPAPILASPRGAASILILGSAYDNLPCCLAGSPGDPPAPRCCFLVRRYASALI